MAFGKFLSSILGKKPDESQGDSQASAVKASFTAEDVFGDLVASLDSHKVRVQPAHASERKPAVVLPSYVPAEDGELILKRKLAQAMAAMKEEEVDANADTEIDGIVLIGAAAPRPPAANSSKAIRTIEARSPTSEPWPDTPIEDVMPKILSLDSIGRSIQEDDTEHDSDIFFPVGHPGLETIPANSDRTTLQPLSPAAKVSALSAMPPVSSQAKPANLGAAHSVGWGLRLAAKLSAANRTPTPPPDSIRIRIKRRPLADTELIPPLYFKKRPPGGI